MFPLCNVYKGKSIIIQAAETAPKPTQSGRRSLVIVDEDDEEDVRARLAHSGAPPLMGTGEGRIVNSSLDKLYVSAVTLR